MPSAQRAIRSDEDGPVVVSTKRRHRTQSDFISGPGERPAAYPSGTQAPNISREHPCTARRRHVSLLFGLKRVGMKSLILLISIASRLYLVYKLFGLINGHLHLVRSVFLCYAGNERYSRHYCFRSTEGWLRWHPTPIGLYKQGRYWGIVFASPMSEAIFTDPHNSTNLQALLSRLTYIATLCRVENIHLAGILPNHVDKHLTDFHIGEPTEVGRVIASAVDALLSRHFVGEDSHHVLLLGGNGRVGRVLQSYLRPGIKIHVVDPRGGLMNIPSGLFGKKALLVDVSRGGVLRQYLSQLWPELLILNEAFPEPPLAVLRPLLDKGLRVFHLSGVEGRVIPSLPFGYAGSVPCCAIHDLGTIIEPLVKELCS
jgi:hypothetical protein